MQLSQGERRQFEAGKKKILEEAGMSRAEKQQKELADKKAKADEIQKKKEEKADEKQKLAYRYILYTLHYPPYWAKVFTSFAGMGSIIGFPLLHCAT